MRDLKERSFNEWLVIESQRGKKDAFNTLIKNWEQRYFLYALNRLKSREAAKAIEFSGKQYRNDIGWREFARAERDPS